MRSNPRATVFVLFLVGALLLTVTAWGQWSKDQATTNKYRPNGQWLPGQGVILGEYISASLNVLSTEDDNELVAKVEAFRASGTYTDYKANKRPEKAYLFCMFFKDNPCSAELSDKDRERLFIPDREQACKEVDGSAIVRFKVPDHASYVMFTVAQGRATNMSTLAAADNVTSWSDELLLEKCRVAPFLNKLAGFSVRRPYRKDAVRQAEEDAGVQFVNCPECNGRGQVFVPEQEGKCKRCNGTGWYPPGKYGMREKCGEDFMARAHGIKGCGGTGRMINPAHWEKCKRCQGTGKVQVE